MRHSIRTRSNLAFIGLAVIPLLLVGIVWAWHSTDDNPFEVKLTEPGWIQGVIL